MRARWFLHALIVCGGLVLPALAQPVRAQGQASQLIGDPNGSATTALPGRTPQERLQRLEAAIKGNQVREDGNLYRTCEATNIKTLLFAMEDANFLFPAKVGIDPAPVTGEMFGSGRPIAICQKLLSTADLHFDYDPDTLIFTLSFLPDLRVDLDFQKVPTPPGPSKPLVDRYVDIEYWISMQRLRNGYEGACGQVKNGLYTVRISAPPTDAAAIKATGRLVISGRFELPYFAETSRSRRPKERQPMDIYQLDLKGFFAPKMLSVVMPDGRTIFACTIQ